LYAHFVISATPSNTAGNYFLKVLSVLSYCFECVQVVESEALLMRFVVPETWEVLAGTILVNLLGVLTKNFFTQCSQCKGSFS
jgi:hypothetical protein